MTSLTILHHPLVEHKLTLLRDKDTHVAKFRNLLREISFLLCYEVLKDLKLDEIEIETPMERMTARKLAGENLCVVSVLRAGNGLMEGMLDLAPSARVGHVGVYRDPNSLQAVEYYLKLPDRLHERLCVVCDPMLATGNSAVSAIDRIKKAGAKRIKFACLVAAPEGVAHFSEAHPDVPITAAALDRELNDHGYILPGLGDAGDRMYGTM